MFAITMFDNQTLKLTMLVDTYHTREDALAAVPDNPRVHYAVAELTDERGISRYTDFQHDQVLTKGHGWNNTVEVHNFQKFDDTQIFCTLCGTVRSWVK